MVAFVFPVSTGISVLKSIRLLLTDSIYTNNVLSVIPLSMAFNHLKIYQVLQEYCITSKWTVSESRSSVPYMCIGGAILAQSCL